MGGSPPTGFRTALWTGVRVLDTSGRSTTGLSTEPPTGVKDAFSGFSSPRIVLVIGVKVEVGNSSDSDSSSLISGVKGVTGVSGVTGVRVLTGVNGVTEVGGASPGIEGETGVSGVTGVRVLTGVSGETGGATGSSLVGPGGVADGRVAPSLVGPAGSGDGSEVSETGSVNASGSIPPSAVAVSGVGATGATG